jgi:hypothetical protein
MLLKCLVKVKGVERIENAEPGKPGWRCSIEGLEERRVVGSTDVEVVSGNAKSFVPLEAGGEYFVECSLGAYKSGDRALPYLQIRKILKNNHK